MRYFLLAMAAAGTYWLTAQNDRPVTAFSDALPGDLIETRVILLNNNTQNIAPVIAGSQQPVFASVILKF